MKVSKAPVAWLVAGFASAVVGLLLAVLFRSPWVSLAGWCLGGLVAIGLLGVFLARDLQRRTRGVAAESELANWMRRLLVVCAIVAVGANAWIIAEAFGRGNW